MGRDDLRCSISVGQRASAAVTSPISDLVGVHAMGIAAKADAAGGVGLGIAIDQQSWRSQGGERCGEVDGGGGFPYPTFLIGDGDDATHRRKTLEIETRTRETDGQRP